MRSRIEVYGVEQLVRRLRELNVDVQATARKALWNVGTYLEKFLKVRLSRGGGGREYLFAPASDNRYKWVPAELSTRSGSRYTSHRASAPGQSPAVFTGRLRSSITHNVTGRPGNRLPNPGGTREVPHAYVGTNVAYGYYLERGARIYPYGNPRLRVNLAPRPWFMVTINAKMPTVAQKIRTTLRTAIDEATKK